MRNYSFITCKSALNKIKQGKAPCRYDLNVYRGCDHGCMYCFALYSHRYLENDNYFGDIYVKMNAAEALERQLASKSWKREVINLGGVTDSYQSCEATFRLMPDIWKMLIKYKTPAVISTKSDLILRDYDLIAELANITYVNIASTVTCTDDLQKVIEPLGVSTTRRFFMLREFRKTNVSTGAHIMPVIPYITDTDENLEWIFSSSKMAGVHYLITAALNLRGQTRQVFFNCAKKYFPDRVEKISALYGNSEVDKTYKRLMYKKIAHLYKKYDISSAYYAPMKEKMGKNYTPIEEFLMAAQL